MSRCKICRSEFVKRSMTHKCCGPECAAECAKQERTKRERKELRARKEKLKTLRDYLKEAQIEFNRYIRERDRELPCISCGRFHTGSYDAGHYRSVGAAPHLRFDEDNCHKQCVPCNQFKSGNAIEYRIGLIHRMGEAVAVRLERDNSIRRWTVAEVVAIRDHYKAKTKALIAERERKAA